MEKYTSKLKSIVKKLKTHQLTLLIVLTGVFLALSFIVTNDNYRCEGDICGLWIGQWHKHDYIWHLALIKMSFNSFPLMHPNYSGAVLDGYNYLLDYLVYLVSKIGISPIDMFFKILPMIFFPPYLYFLFKNSRLYNKSNIYLNSFLFFALLGTSFSYLISLYIGRGLYYSTLAGFPVVTSIQPTTVFLNMQYAYSLLVLLVVIYLMQLKSRTPLQALALLVLSAIAVSLKFYAVFVLTLLVGVYGTWQVLKTASLKRFWDLLLPTALGVLLSIVWFYNPFKELANSGFAYDPFAITHHMTEDINLFYNQYLTNARYFLTAHGVSPRLVAIEALNIILFLLVNYGTRIIAVYSIIAKIKNKQWNLFDTALLITIVVLTLFPILFVQRGSFYNTMQFLYYAIFLSSYFAADALFRLLTVFKNRILSYILIMLIVAATVPTHFDQFRYLSEPQRVTTQAELEALEYLESLPSGNVFVTHSHKKDAYISAFSGKPTYFTDIDQLDVTRVSATEREQIVIRPWLLVPQDIDVRYWYLRKSDEDFSIINDKIKSDPAFKVLYENNEIILYERDRIMLINRKIEQESNND